MLCTPWNRVGTSSLSICKVAHSNTETTKGGPEQAVYTCPQLNFDTSCTWPSANDMVLLGKLNAVARPSREWECIGGHPHSLWSIDAGSA